MVCPAGAGITFVCGAARALGETEKMPVPAVGFDQCDNKGDTTAGI